jgi:hypothetical protein
MVEVPSSGFTMAAKVKSFLSWRGGGSIHSVTVSALEVDKRRDSRDDVMRFLRRIIMVKQKQKANNHG